MKTLQLLLAAAMFGLVLFALLGSGTFLLVRNVPMIIEGWRSESWPTAPGVIKESAAVSKPIITDPRRGTVGSHVVVVRYEFSVEGRSYSGTRQGLDDVGIIKHEEVARREAEAMPTGSAVPVFYDPRDPTRSLLAPGVPISGLISSTFGILLVAAGAVLIGTGLYLRSHHAKRRKRISA